MHLFLNYQFLKVSLILNQLLQLFFLQIVQNIKILPQIKNLCLELKHLNMKFLIVHNKVTNLKFFHLVYIAFFNILIHILSFLFIKKFNTFIHYKYYFDYLILI